MSEESQLNEEAKSLGLTNEEYDIVRSLSSLVRKLIDQNKLILASAVYHNDKLYDVSINIEESP